MVLSGLSLAMASSPSTRSVTESLYQKHKQKQKQGGSSTSAAALVHGSSSSMERISESFKESVVSKSLPVNIPSRAAEKRLSGVGSSLGTPRSVAETTAATSAQLSGLVAPVRPASYGSAKTVGFLTKPLLNKTVQEGFQTKKEKAATTSLPNTANLKQQSGNNNSSLLTMALSSEEDHDVESEVGSFNSRNEELAINQEKRISAELTDRHEVFGAPLVKLAFELSRCAHTGKLRKNGETYLSHVVETAEVLANLGLDEQTVAAGLLHDVLDDTMMTEQQLREYIPHEVVDMVVGASRMSQVSQMNRDLGCLGGSKQALETQVDRFRNMLLSMADVRVVLIKLADRLHNMRTLNALTPEKQRIIAQETMNVFVPLANRLGVWSIKAELEDLCFRYLNQSEFLALQNCMKEDFMKSQKENLQKNLDKLQDELKARNFGIKDLRGRPKNIYGIHKKMKTKGITFEEVYDLCACRVIVKSKSECYKVLDLIHSIWEPVEGKFRDYVKNPKENGYESLHTVVVDEHGNPFEIQIRTAEMHFIAEYGVAAHWQYKESDKNGQKSSTKKNKRAEQQIAWNRWLLTWQMELQDRKFRPSGSPDNPRGVFSSFPEDEPAPPSVEEMDYDPIYAIVANQGQVNVKEVPARCSLYQFSKDILKMQPGTQFLVNNEYHDDADDYTLQMGDLVEVVEMESSMSSGHSSGVSYFSDEFDVVESDDEPVFDLFDFERQKLDKMYNESDSLDYLTKSGGTQDEEIVV